MIDGAPDRSRRVRRRIAKGFGVLLAGTAAALLLCWLAPAPGGGEDAAFAWGAPGREGPGRFDKPRCVAIAPDGTVWVLDLTGRIQHFTPDGEFLGQLRMPDVTVGRPQGIDVGPGGAVYVADTHYNQVVKFDPVSGAIVLRFGEMGKAPGELYWPCAIVVAPDGTIYTAEYATHDRIQVWSPEGRFLKTWGRHGQGPGEFIRPAGLALDGAGRLYVADSGNDRVQVFDGDGAFLRAWGTTGEGPGAFRSPFDIAMDGRGRLFVVEYTGHRLQVFSADGARLGGWGGLAKRPARNGLAMPWGVDAAPGGTVFVADTYNYRVIRLDRFAGTP